MHVEDRKQLEAGKFTTALWPNTWADVEHQARYGRTDHKDYDMSSVETVRGESTFMVLSYDQLIDLPDTVAEPDGEPKAD